jgi:putative transposase
MISMIISVFTDLLFLMNSNRPIDFRAIRSEVTSVYDFDRGEPLVAIGAYCLMPNHFHILVTPVVEDGVSIFLGKLCTSYSMYFNKKYKRNGALFQGKFKSEWADSDPYLKYLFAYIHLNPVKLLDQTWKEEGIKDPEKAYAFAVSFQYSSLYDYINPMSPKRPEASILKSAAFPKYFITATNQKQELFEWLTYKKDSTYQINNH